MNMVPPPPCDPIEDPGCDSGGGGGGGGGGTTPTLRTGTHSEVLRFVNVHNDREQWTKEPAEIVLQINGAASPNATIKEYFASDPEPETQTHSYGTFLFNWTTGVHGHFYSMRWRELEGGSPFSFSIPVSGEVPVPGAPDGTTVSTGVTFNYQQRTEDETMGAQGVSFTDDLGLTYDTGWVSFGLQ